MVASQLMYKVSLEEELLRYPGLRVEDITAVQQWLLTQPHLPPLSDIQIAHFLHASYYNIDVTKKTIYKNIKYKTTMPEFFTNWDSQYEITEFARKVMPFAVLPKESLSDARLLLIRMQKNSAENFDFPLAVKLMFMTYQSILFAEGQQQEFKLVIDADSFTFSILKKFTLSLLKKHYDFCEKAATIRVVGFIFLNTNSVISNIMAISKPFTSKERLNLVSLYKSPEPFFKTLTPEVVPLDYGGSAPSSDDLCEENIRRIQDTRESLVVYSEQKLVDSEIPGKKKNQPKLISEFRKLELD